MSKIENRRTRERDRTGHTYGVCPCPVPLPATPCGTQRDNVTSCPAVTHSWLAISANRCGAHGPARLRVLHRGSATVDPVMSGRRSRDEGAVVSTWPCHSHL